MAHSNSKSDLDSCSESKLDIEREFKASYPKIPIEISNYIDELCFSYICALKKISELKKENSWLRQHNSSKKGKIEFLPKEFHLMRENQDLLAKENDVLEKEFLDISTKFFQG